MNRMNKAQTERLQARLSLAADARIDKYKKSLGPHPGLSAKITSPKAKLKARFGRFVSERDALSEALGKAVREHLEPGYLYPIKYDGMPRFVAGGDESDEDHSSHDQPIAAFIDSDGELSVLCEGNVTWQMDEAVSDVSYMYMMVAALDAPRRRRLVDNDTNREKLTR